jgi:hypothetical protein
MDLRKMERIPEFTECGVCNKKISRRRKKVSKKQDISGEYPIIQSQFCSPTCAKIGYKIYMDILGERKRIESVIGSAMKMISDKREKAIQEHGNIHNIPYEEAIKLYPGSIKLLNRIKEKINKR